MSGVRIVISELFRSFRKSIVENIILMVTLSIGIVMAVIMCSYYFDLGDRWAERNRNVDDDIWYEADIMTEGDRDIEARIMTAKGCRTIIEYYERMTSSSDWSTLSVNTYQNLFARERDYVDYLGDRDFTSFQTDYQTGAFGATFGEESCSVVNLLSAQVDLNAYEYFGLRVQEGEGFTEANMTLDTVMDAIPIVLGSDYTGIIDVGDVIDLEFWCFIYPCRVVGILEQGESLPEFGRVGNLELCGLDSKILFPQGIRILDTTGDVSDLRKFANLSYISLQNGIFRVDKKTEIRKVVETMRSISAEYNLPFIRLCGTSQGIELLRKESTSTIAIMAIMTIILIFFVFYGVVVTFYNKIQVNRRSYGIYMMNGCSSNVILASYLLEIVIIILPAILICYTICKRGEMDYFDAMAIMRTVMVFVSLVLVVSAAFVVQIFHGLDLEHLIKQKE